MSETRMTVVPIEKMLVVPKKRFLRMTQDYRDYLDEYWKNLGYITQTGIPAYKKICKLYGMKHRYFKLVIDGYLALPLDLILQWVESGLDWSLTYEEYCHMHGRVPLRRMIDSVGRFIGLG